MNISNYKIRSFPHAFTAAQDVEINLRAANVSMRGALQINSTKTGADRHCENLQALLPYSGAIGLPTLTYENL